MAKVETMDVLVAMAKAILEIAGETAEATPVKAEKPAKAEKAKAEKKAAPADVEDTEDDDDLDGKTTKELYQMCVDAGIKVPKYGKNKAFYIAALQGGSAEDTDGDEADDEVEDEGDVEAKYGGKSAKELFELCKKRGIKAAPKKKADVYIELLKKADAAEAEADADEDDDWDDDEAEEAPAPKKQAKQKPKAKAKKKVEEPEEDDEDDDWDI